MQHAEKYLCFPVFAEFDEFFLYFARFGEFNKKTFYFLLFLSNKVLPCAIFALFYIVRAYNKGGGAV